MTDPFHVLRRPLVRLAPDPAFAARLRDRVQHALAEGVPMTTAPQLATTEGDVAYLSLQLPDTGRAREFYRAVLGWRFGAGEEPGHSAQVDGQSLPLGIWDGPPSPGIRTPGVLLVHRVADIVASTTTVRSLGGTAGPPHQEPYGVTSQCTDNQEMTFTLGQL